MLMGFCICFFFFFFGGGGRGEFQSNAVNYIYSYWTETGFSQLISNTHLWKNCALVLEYSRPRAQFFPIWTLWSVNNTYLSCNEKNVS